MRTYFIIYLTCNLCISLTLILGYIGKIDSLIKSTTARVDGLVKEVAELKYSLQYSQKDIDSQQKDLDSKQMEINSISAEITNIKTSLNKFGDKTVDLENRSRRNNLRIVGIPEKPGETWEESEALVKSALKEKLGLRTEPRIERAHRTGKSIRSDSSVQLSVGFTTGKKKSIFSNKLE